MATVRIVANDLRQFGLRAMRAGQNPAEKVFQLATLEGYTASADTSAARLATVAKGVQGTRGARSSAPASNGALTLETASRMSYRELAKMSDDQWAKLMGGA
jgi:hypothetical protein